MFDNNTNQNSGFQVGTGNNLVNALIGGLSGGADAIQQRGWYAPQFQWSGNGLAQNRMQFLANPKYRDYASGGRMLSSALRGNGDNSGSLFGSLGGKLQSLFGSQVDNGGQTLEDINNPNLFGNNYGLPTSGYQIPEGLQSFLGPNIYGQPNTLGGGDIGNYSLPTKDQSFKFSWEK